MAIPIKKVIQCGIILLSLAWVLFYAMGSAINITTVHIDGAFQTASALFRLDSGQFPGKDFFPYLGIGLLFILYPVFKAFGANLAASMIAAQSVTLIFGWLYASLIWHLVWRPKAFMTSVTAGVVTFILPLAISLYFYKFLPSWFIFGISPGPSLRPVRAFAPYLLAMVYYFCILRLHSQRLKYIFSGILTGVILLWTNDFAIPSAGLFALFIGVSAWRGHEFKLKNVLLYIVVAVLSWLLLLCLATQGYPSALLKYNFFDVVKDQWWYFPPYGEAHRIFNLLQLTKLISIKTLFAFIVLALIAVLAVKTRLIEHALLLWIGLVLFAGGALASVGGHLDNYFGSLKFWAGMTFTVCFLHWVWLAIKRLLKYKVPEVDVALLLIFCLMLILVAYMGRNFEMRLYSAKHDPQRFYVPELGGYLDWQWKDYIELARRTDTHQVIEEYWGLWSATRKIFPAWPVDSVIHALGGIREVAANDLQQADIIISTRYTLSPEWQPWSLSENYWFYGQLLNHWTPYELSPTTIVWRKSTQPALFKSIDCTMDKKLSSLILNAPQPGFYEVEMKYALSGAGRALILVKNNISFGMDADGYVSLNPSGRSAKFPVYISQAGRIPLEIKVTKRLDDTLELAGCAAHEISLNNSNVLHVPRMPTDVFFTTGKLWDHGVARFWAGFLLPNTKDFTSRYTVGQKVRFLDGEVRKIINTQLSGPFLYVIVDGDPLNFKQVGLPNKYTVVGQ